MNNLPTYNLYKFGLAQKQNIIFSTDIDKQSAVLIESNARQHFLTLISDKESESVRYLAKKIIDGTHHFFDENVDQDTMRMLDAEKPEEALKQHVAKSTEQIKAQLQETLKCPFSRKHIQKNRAILSLLHGCWLDLIAQPATQPDVLCNTLFTQSDWLKGHGQVQATRAALIRQALQANDIHVPELSDFDFLDHTDCSDYMVLLANYQLALTHYPVNHLPRIVAVNYVYQLLDIDQYIYELDTTYPHQHLNSQVQLFLKQAEAAVDKQALYLEFISGLRFAIDSINTQIQFLIARVEEKRSENVADRVAAMIQLYGPLADKQHKRIKVGQYQLATMFMESDFDVYDFMDQLKSSVFMRQQQDGSCRFLNALKLDGPMFGIFNQAEYDDLVSWINDENTHKIKASRASDKLVFFVDDWLKSIHHVKTQGTEFKTYLHGDVRQEFFHIVNIEFFPHAIDHFKALAKHNIEDSRRMFECGDQCQFTNTNAFEYSAEELNAHFDRIYWDKLVKPYEKLSSIPDREDVIQGQLTFMLGNLIDGSWSCRIGLTDRLKTQVSATLNHIFADEMGFGDVHKNHIHLIYLVLQSMDVELPHISSKAFIDQHVLVDELYPFAIAQMALSLFPDSYYAEIMGYNLAIEMFGLGEMRMHEIEKLRKWGFDTSYERAHLAIDNYASGHSRKSVDLTIQHMESMAKIMSGDCLRLYWERIWLGYCSFAKYVESRNINFAETRDHEPDDHNEELLII